MASVERGFRDLSSEHPNTARQQPIERTLEISGGDRAFKRDAGNLSQSMDTRVGSPRALRKNDLSSDVTDRRRKRALHGGQVRLDLPAMEGGSVVAEGQLPEGHIVRLHGTMNNFGIDLRYTLSNPKNAHTRLTRSDWNC